MHNKDKAFFDKKYPYEYNICLYILEELCDKGVIDVFIISETIILLRKKYKITMKNNTYYDFVNMTVYYSIFEKNRKYYINIINKNSEKND